MINLNCVLALIILIGVNVSQSQSPYCNIPTCNPSNSNTLCKFTANTWGANCNSASCPGITAAQREEILSLHNQHRRKVAQGLETRGNPGPQPAASNMRDMVWDDELAQMAQTHAQQCVLEHDFCRDVGRFRVGQNIYWDISSTPDWAGAFSSWYNEVDLMSRDFVSKFPFDFISSIGHYTQIVWAETFAIGCGVVSFQSSGFSMFYVCNYGPAGNVFDLPLYIQGAVRSNCPAGIGGNDCAFENFSNNLEPF